MLATPGLLAHAFKTWSLLLLLMVPLIATSAESGPTTGTAPNTVNLAKAPEGAKTIAMSLSASDSGPRQPGYLTQRTTEPLPETTNLPGNITESYAGKEFSAYDIATLPDGTRYTTVLNEDKTLRFLNRNESSMWYARITESARRAAPNLSSSEKASSRPATM